MKRILHDNGIDPAPERSRRMPWKTFLQAHWEGLTACDLFTVEVLTLAGLQRYLVFFVIALQSRRVTIAGIPEYAGRLRRRRGRRARPHRGHALGVSSRVDSVWPATIALCQPRNRVTFQ